jgi:hypothetical protein
MRPPFEAKQWADEPRLDCSFEDRSGQWKLGLALPPQPREAIDLEVAIEVRAGGG